MLRLAFAHNHLNSHKEMLTGELEDCLLHTSRKLGRSDNLCLINQIATDQMNQYVTSSEVRSPTHI